MNKQSGNPAWRYMGMGAQFVVAIGLGLFLGKKGDDWLGFSSPLLIWLLPLFLLAGMMIKIVIDTSKKQE